MSSFNRQKLLSATALIALACVSCGGQDNPAQGTPSGSQIEASIPTPDTVNPALQEQLEHALDKALLDAGRTRETRSAATGPGSSSPDLVILESTPTDLVAIWSYRNQGDYDLNGEVNVSDLTPLGQNFLKTQQDVDWIKAQWADGDFNGQNNLADVTAIGQNFGARVEGYQLEINDGLSEIWAPLISKQLSLGGNLQQGLPFQKPAGFHNYRVRPYFDNGTEFEYGTPSNIASFGFINGSVWPMLGGNAQHTGRSILPGPNALNVYREVELEGRIFASSPVVGNDGSVYICTTFPGEGYGYIYCVGLDYKVRFRHRTRDEIITTPAIDNAGRIVAVDLSGNVYCLAPDGRLYYEMQLPGGEAVSPTISGRTVYVATNTNNMLNCIDEDGMLLWQAALGADTLSSAAVLSNGEIVIPDVGGTTRYFDNTGIVTGVSSLGVQFITTPCVDGNVPFCAAFAEQQLFRISPLGGTSILSVTTFPSTSPALDGSGNLLVGCIDFTATPPNGRLFSVDQLGVPQWNVSLAIPMSTQPVIDSFGRIYVTGSGESSNTGVWCLDTNHTLLWDYSTWPDYPSSPAIVSTATLVFGLTPANGTDNTCKLVWIRPELIA
jgi:hypothetical protein